MGNLSLADSFSKFYLPAGFVCCMLFRHSRASRTLAALFNKFEKPASFFP